MSDRRGSIKQSSHKPGGQGRGPGQGEGMPREARAWKSRGDGRGGWSGAGGGGGAKGGGAGGVLGQEPACAGSTRGGRQRPNSGLMSPSLDFQEGGSVQGASAEQQGGAACNEPETFNYGQMASMQGEFARTSLMRSEDDLDWRDFPVEQWETDAGGSLTSLLKDQWEK